jgi:hypothetical protein
MACTAIDKSQWAPVEREEHRHDFFADWEQYPFSFFHDVGRMLAPVMAKLKRARGGLHFGKLNSAGVPIADYTVSWNRVSIVMTPHGAALAVAKSRGVAFAEYLLGEHDAAKLQDILESVDFDFADFVGEVGYGDSLRFNGSPDEYVAFSVGCINAIQAIPT